MVFRRREKRKGWDRVRDFFYPQGGWIRAGRYVFYRLTRLPDPPHRIARGIFAGVFISFTPLFGLHFLCAALIAFLLRGNIIASLLATFFGNPVTFPLIATGSLQLGHWLLGTGIDVVVPASQILSTFANAGGEVWSNVLGMIFDTPTEWAKLHHFYYGLFKPYLVGGVIPGLVCGALCAYISLPVIHGYQKLRSKRRRDRAERLRDKASLRACASSASGEPPSVG